MFLRTSEFLWQEGHTAHATHDEAFEEVMRMLDNYVDFAHAFMAMPVIKGKKTDSEKFAGALSTYTFEALMQDGKALQAGTSHDLGQNFGRAFNVMFQNAAGEREYVWQTSWGVTTRLVGALIMTHSDDTGLVLPPKLAPLQVVVIPIPAKEGVQTAVLDAAARIKQQLALAGIRCRIDDRQELRPGAKHYEWERKGVPIRIEIGPRDLGKSICIAKRRDQSAKVITELPLDAVAERVAELLESVQESLFSRAREFTASHIKIVDSHDELAATLDGGCAALVHWDGTATTEKRFKDEFKATIRCIPLDTNDDAGKCVLTGMPSPRRVLVAQAY
jgi:prolyl-tRNA synthetase